MAAQRNRLVSAVHLFLVRDGRVLLLRRYETGYEDGNYSVIAGHLEGGEEVTTAAIREAREEVAITVAASDLRVVGVMHRRAEDERIDFFLDATRWQGEPTIAEPDKCDELRWVDLQRLPPNVVGYVRRALANYRAGTFFDSFGWTSPARPAGRSERPKQ